MFTSKALSVATISMLSLSIALYGNSALANKSIKNDNYSIKVIENCKVITEIPLTPQQTQAYLALRNEEDKMAELESPIPAIEAQLEEYTSQIEQLSQQAFTDSEQSFRINKVALAKQKQVVKKLDKLMAVHQADFDALSAQGKRIGDIADKFSKLIAPAIANIKHHHITISHLNEGLLDNSCNSSTRKL